MAKTGAQTQKHKIFSGLGGFDLYNDWEEKTSKGHRNAKKYKSEIIGRWVTKKEIRDLCGIDRWEFDKLFYKRNKTIDEILLIYGVGNEGR